jgi:hypothetical protein
MQKEVSHIIEVLKGSNKGKSEENPMLSTLAIRNAAKEDAMRRTPSAGKTKGTDTSL